MTQVCKDCIADFKATEGEKEFTAVYRPRPIVERSGGRCATHWSKEKRRRREASHEKRVEKVYGLQRGQYETLYEAQGGRCYICQRATGKTRRLSVDHDHQSGYVRGLLCRPCNSMLGHIRDDALVAKRAAYYLQHPPAFGVLGKVKPNG